MFTFDFVVHTRVSEFIKLDSGLTLKRNCRRRAGLLTHAPDLVGISWKILKLSTSFSLSPLAVTFFSGRVLLVWFQKRDWEHGAKWERSFVCEHRMHTHFNEKKLFYIFSVLATEKFLFYQTQQDSPMFNIIFLCVPFSSCSLRFISAPKK